LTYSHSISQAVASQNGSCVRRVAMSLPQHHIQTHHLSVIMALQPAIPRRYVSMTCSNLFPFLLCSRCMLLSPVRRQFADLLLQCGGRSGTLGCRKSYKWERRPHPCFLSRHRISSSLQRQQVKEVLRISGKILAFGLRQWPRCRLGWSRQLKYYLLLDHPAHGSRESCQASEESNSQFESILPSEPLFDELGVALSGPGHPPSLLEQGPSGQHRRERQRLAASSQQPAASSLQPATSSAAIESRNSLSWLNFILH
jgi:hypothetical protein